MKAPVTLMPTAPPASSRELKRNRSESRAGSSTKRVVSTARTSATPDHVSRPKTPICQSRTTPNPTNGQCHRYHEYDTRPNQRRIGEPRISLTVLSGERYPQTLIDRVPRAGRMGEADGDGG